MPLLVGSTGEALIATEVHLGHRALALIGELVEHRISHTLFARHTLLPHFYEVGRAVHIL